MARCFDIHPVSPQQRMVVQVADIVRAGGVIAYPTDSCYALGSRTSGAGRAVPQAGRLPPRQPRRPRPVRSPA
jgi:tRNA A37 threonylcarbamoyladenosine synthetase subunit TsaC/SUA5/YrdC